MLNDLIGGSVFFRSNTWLSKIVRFAGLFQKGHKISKWSHCGSIYLHSDGKLHLLEALFPEGVVSNPLVDALASKKGKKFEIKKLKKYLRDRLQEDVYNHACESYIGKDYNFIGAIAAGCDLPLEIKTKKALHCSFLDCHLKQIGKVLSPFYNANEFVPDDMLNSGIYL